MSSPAVEIERASGEHAEELLKLQYLCYQGEAQRYGNYRLAPLTQSLASLKNELTDGIALVARCDGDIVGSVRGRVDGESFKIGKLVVHPRVQRRGVASRLLRHIESAVSGVRFHEVFTGHLSVEFLRLYEAAGYVRYRIEPVSEVLQLVYLRKPAPGLAGPQRDASGGCT